MGRHNPLTVSGDQRSKETPGHLHQNARGMVKIKLYSLAQPFKAAATMPGVLVKGATGLADSAASAVNTGFTSGLDGVFSLGKGLRDFILRGTVVELAVAVVLGTAFTNLIASATADLITPLIAAIFQGTNFQDLYFVVNSSMFKYGELGAWACLGRCSCSCCVSAS